MSARNACSIAVAMVVASASAGEVRGEEPAPPRAAPVAKVKTAAAPVEKAADKQAAARPRAEGVGVDVEPFAAPILRVLVGNLNRARPAPAAVAVNDAVAQQYIAQLRPMLLAELTFVRQMCELAPEQRPAIRAAGEAALKDAARAMVNQQQPQVRVFGAPTTSKEPRVIIRRAIEKAVLATLGEVQGTEFLEESARREKFRQRIAVRYVVSRLDSTLFLTEPQRDEIAKTLTEKWQDDWDNWLMLPNYGDRYFPSIPDQYVVGPLNPEQVSVWRGLQKISLRGTSFNNGVAAEDDGWWGGGPLGGQDGAAVLFAE